MMTFLCNMHLHDLTIMQMLDGRAVIYTPDGGTPRVLSGMFQEFAETVNGESVDILSCRYVLSVRSIDACEIRAGDQFRIDSNDYEVEIIRLPNEGITELILERL